MKNFKQLKDKFKKYTSNYRHRTQDLLISLIAFSLLAFMTTKVNAGEVPSWEVNSFRSINDLPDIVNYVIWPFMQYGVFVTIPFAAAIAFYFKKYRLATLLLLGGLGIYYLARIFKEEFPRGRPAELLGGVHVREYFAPWSKGFTSGHTAVAATIATFSHYYLHRKWQIASIVTLLIVVIGRIYSGAHLPLDVLGGVALGVGVASLLNYIVGVPHREKTLEETEDWIKRHRPQHPSDILRMVIAAFLFVIFTTLALTGSVSGLEDAVFRMFNLLPEFLDPIVVIIMQFGALYFVFIATGIAFLSKHYRTTIKLMVGGVGVWLSSKVAKALVDRERPFYLLQNVINRANNTGLGFPSGHAAVAALIATVSAPYVTKNWSRFIWFLAWITALGRIYVGAHLPLDVFAGMAIGWFAGSLLNFTFGTPAKPWPKKDILNTLKDAGLELSELKEATVDARGSIPLYGKTKSGKQVFIKTIDNEHRDADILFRLWRLITLKKIQDEAPFSSARRLAEHEAYLSMQASQVGVKTAKVLIATPVNNSASIIVSKRIDGKVLSEYKGKIDSELLKRIFNEIKILHKNRISHRDLRASNIMIDRRRKPWLIDFSFSQTAATNHHINNDLVELIVSLSLYSDFQTVIKVAIEVLGKDTIKNLQPYIQTAILTKNTKSLVKINPTIINNIDLEIRKQTKAIPLPKAKMTRISFRWLIFVVIVGAASYLIIPNFSEIGESVLAIKSGDLQFVFVAFLASILTYVISAWVIIGASKYPIRYWPSFVFQFASTTVNRITPKGIGAAIMLGRYYERNRHKPLEASISVSLVYGVGILMHILLTLMAVIWTDPNLINDIINSANAKLSNTQIIFVTVIVLVMLSGIAYVPKIKRAIKQWYRNLRQGLHLVFRNRMKFIKLFGGSIGITLAYAVAFYFSVKAFGVDIQFKETLFVYLAANIFISTAPTPGGLIAAEAALSLGLTVFGVSVGQAVASVLVFRMLTFWLPIIPGLFAFRYLNKRNLV